ncbi:hypothetical protein F511_38775 [Dorcoceras hygrometricum]|uniref:Uncharacterized protein n=1 Tax=Dorcoceras hygrometricum TaxID=472368 RepID=A0A2Z7CCM9_9LAMI|nr:hypothetical protein F511_38775 [Dorcoceras hygrometricum]
MLEIEMKAIHRAVRKWIERIAGDGVMIKQSANLRGNGETRNRNMHYPVSDTDPSTRNARRSRGPGFALISHLYLYSKCLFTPNLATSTWSKFLSLF